VEEQRGGGEPTQGATRITPETAQKILYGMRVPNLHSLGGWSQALVGAHSPKLKKSTLAPESWSDEKIIATTQQTGDTLAIAARARDGATLHRQRVEGVE